jgi:hypothetical protein
VTNPRDPRGGLRGLDAPEIPGSVSPDAERAAAEERSGVRIVKFIVFGLVGTTFLFTVLDVILSRR